MAEDERIERMALVKVLSDALGEGYAIHEAENGRQAVELFRQHPIGVAILDIEMPVMSGIDTAQIIHSEAPDCAILFLTAYDRFEYAQNAIRVRALEYLLKPYDDEELLAAGESAIHRPLHGRAAPPAAEPADDGADPRADMAAAVAARMLDFIRTHYQQEISMQDGRAGAELLGAVFLPHFQAAVGRSFTAYLSAYRVERAQELLAQPTVSIKDVGRRVGYPDANYFTKVFRRITGQSPSEYAPAGCKASGGAALPQTVRPSGTKRKFCTLHKQHPPTFGQNVGGCFVLVAQGDKMFPILQKSYDTIGRAAPAIIKP